MGTDRCNGIPVASAGAVKAVEVVSFDRCDAKIEGLGVICREPS